MGRASRPTGELRDVRVRVHLGTRHLEVVLGPRLELEESQVPISAWSRRFALHNPNVAHGADGLARRRRHRQSV